jgi:hypothetical protein
MQLGALANPQEPGAFTNLQDPVRQYCVQPRSSFVTNFDFIYFIQGISYFKIHIIFRMQWGGHALYYACCFGHVGVIEALLSAPTTKLNSRQEVNISAERCR